MELTRPNLFSRAHIPSQPLGTLVASGIAYAFIPRYSCGGGAGELDPSAQAACTRAANSGWRYAIYTIGAITLFIFFIRFFVFNFRESPAYLINKGHEEEALRVLYSIAKLNKAPQPQLTLEDFKLIDNHCDRQQRRSRVASTVSDAPSEEIAKPIATQTTISDGGSDPFSGGTDVHHGGNATTAEKEPQVESTWQLFKKALGDAGQQLKGVKLLFRDRKMGRVTILLWLTYMAE